MTKMVEPQHVPLKTKEEIRGIQSLRNNLYTFKIDAALDRRPVYGNHNVPDSAMAAPMICESMESGAFPMAFISGWPGRNTANTLLH